MKDSVALLIPGNMCDARMWRGSDDVIIRTLAANFGTQPRNADTFRYDSIAAMARRALDSTSGPLLPVGFSMGAIIAVEIALMAPDRVSGLILSGYNASGDLPERARNRIIQQKSVANGELDRILIEELKPNYLAQANKEKPELLDLLFDMAISAGPQIFLQQSEALRLREDRIAHLSRLNIPILYVAGHEDSLCPPEWHRRWARLTRCSSMIEIMDAGHMTPLEQPTIFAQEIANWIEQNSERKAA